VFKVSYNKGGALITLFNFVGVGFAQVKTKKEQSVTITLKIWKLHTFLSFAWI
tara:strand:+ start:5127 stop:5285 length:159 start_codon:yes stop_codon:yes gene_type:complete